MLMSWATLQVVLGRGQNLCHSLTNGAGAHHCLCCEVFATLGMGSSRVCTRGSWRERNASLFCPIDLTVGRKQSQVRRSCGMRMSP
jgi:hypothetical protein